MDAMERVESLLPTMTRDEKARLFQIVADELSGEEFPGVESAPGVSGGEPRIIRTRVPVWILERARRLGLSEAEILRAYPSLRSGDLLHAWAYVRAHLEEIEAQIHDNEEA